MSIESLPLIKNTAASDYHRKCRLYCVGAAKTGTTSIGSLFDDTVRTAHEPESEEVIGKILGIAESRVQDSEVFDYIRKRDKRLCLDVDSSQLNFFLLNYLLKEFSDARYLLTIRDCYSWLGSFINHSLARGGGSNAWVKLREYRFRASVLSHPSEERALKEKGLYTLDGYLSYWASHNSRVLASVPEERLMVVKTNEITKRVDEIADFAGLSRASIRLGHSHRNKHAAKFSVLQEIPPEYIEAKVHKYCEPLMTKFFPEIRSINDSNI